MYVSRQIVADDRPSVLEYLFDKIYSLLKVIND